MVLVSSCLLGEDCKYNGENNYNQAVKEAVAGEEVISVCPESCGGLPIPRPPAEIKGGTGKEVWTGNARVVNEEGEDLTARFIKGARETLQQAKTNNCRFAILKARSPSCGSKEIYDGSFEGETKPGVGVTTALLEQEGIKVINEEELNKLNELKGD